MLRLSTDYRLALFIDPTRLLSRCILLWQIHYKRDILLYSFINIQVGLTEIRCHSNKLETYWLVSCWGWMYLTLLYCVCLAKVIILFALIYFREIQYKSIFTLRVSFCCKNSKELSINFVFTVDDLTDILAHRCLVQSDFIVIFTWIIIVWLRGWWRFDDCLAHFIHKFHLLRW